MGGFFGDIGDFFKDAGNWVKNAGEDVFNGVVKPVFNDVVKPVATGVFDVAKPVLQPVLGAVGQTGARLVNASGRFAEGSLQNITNLQGGLTNLITSPILYIGLGIVAIILVPKILDKMV